MRRQILIVLAGWAMITMAVAGDPKYGGELRIALDSDIASTEPGVRRDGNSDTVLHHIVESLVAYDGHMKASPLLADSIEVSEDKLRYTFKIRRGAKFHNGAPVTAAEVKWSWDRMLNPDTGWECASWYKPDGRAKLKSIETPSEDTIVFQLAEPTSLFLQYMASPQCITAILHPDSVDASGKFTGPVGTGPYQLAEWKKSEYVLLEKFADYTPRKEPRSGLAGGRIAYAQKVRWLVIPDSAARLAALASGQVDLLSIDVSEVPAVKQLGSVQVQTVQGLSWNVILIQTLDPVLSDIRVRKAIAHAIDLETLVEVRTEGLGKPNPSAVPDVSPYYSDVHAKGLGFDPAKAVALLKEAGYDGKPIKLIANRKLGYMYDTAVVVQSMLKRVGLNVELEVMDWATQLERYSKGDFQLQSFRFSARLDPTLNYGTFLGPKSEDPENQWDDTKFSELALTSGVEFDEGKRSKIFEELHLGMTEAVPIISLYNSIIVEAVTDHISGNEPSPLGKIRAWGVWVDK